MSFFVLPATRDLECYRNGIFRQDFFVTENAVPKDLTGWSLVMQLRDAPATAPIRLEINTTTPTANDSEIIITDAPGGAFQLYISNADLEALPQMANVATVKTFYYDVVFHEPAPGTDFCPVYKGSFAINPGVTNDDPV